MSKKAPPHDYESDLLTEPTVEQMYKPGSTVYIRPASDDEVLDLFDREVIDDLYEGIIVVCDPETSDVIAYCDNTLEALAAARQNNLDPYVVN